MADTSSATRFRSRQCWCEGVPKISADAVQIQQVIVNLVRNAI
jgi:signal transduction histidine kinase